MHMRMVERDCGGVGGSGTPKKREKGDFWAQLSKGWQCQKWHMEWPILPLPHMTKRGRICLCCSAVNARVQ